MKRNFRNLYLQIGHLVDYHKLFLILLLLYYFFVYLRRCRIKLKSNGNNYINKTVFNT